VREANLHSNVRITAKAVGIPIWLYEVGAILREIEPSLLCSWVVVFSAAVLEPGIYSIAPVTVTAAVNLIRAW
jgi:hypothetical protein